MRPRTDQVLGSAANSRRPLTLPRPREAMIIFARECVQGAIDRARLTVGFGSIVLKNSEIERPRESRFRARRVISTDSPDGRAYGRVARGKTPRSAEPLRKIPSRLPAVF